MLYTFVMDMVFLYSLDTSRCVIMTAAVPVWFQTNAGQTSTITLPVQGAGAFQQHLTSLQYLGKHWLSDGQIP